MDHLWAAVTQRVLFVLYIALQRHYLIFAGKGKREYEVSSRKKERGGNGGR